MRVVFKVIDGPQVGKEVGIQGYGQFLAGRSEKADIPLLVEDPTISREHFQLEVNRSGCRLTVRRATNRTYVNDEAVQTCDLKNGDTLRAGRTTFQVLIGPASAGRRPPTTIKAHDQPENVAQAARPSALPVTRRAPGHLPEGPRIDPEAAAPHRCQVCGKCGRDVIGMAKRLPGNRPPVLDWPLCGACWRGYLTCPQAVPAYWAVAELGCGAFSVVHKALDTRTGRIVATKTLRSEAALNARDVQRFHREAAILCLLDHPNIVKFQGLMQLDRSLTIAMEYVAGKTAEEWVAENGPIPIDQAVLLACEILKALEYAHTREQPVIHRDVKPSNVILVGDAQGGYFVKLADFGLARIIDGLPWSVLTPRNVAGGTPFFMSPEQADDFHSATSAADQYSTAATLYYLLTGEYTHDVPEGEVTDQLKMLKTTAPIPIRERRPDVPERLANIIHKALDKDPARRYGSDIGFRRALMLCLRTARNDKQ